MKHNNKTYRFAFQIIGFVALLMGQVYVHAQQIESDSSFFEIEGRENQRIGIPFELINNLVVVEARLNGSTPLKFIVDTGVRYTLITSLYDEQVFLKSSRPITLAGLGGGETLQAYYSEDNELAINGATGKNLNVVILQEDIFKLASFMGTKVHGLIGYDLFANFAVEINYKRKHIYLYKPDAFREKFRKLPQHRKWYEYPLYLEDRKAYLNLDYNSPTADTLVPLRLLVDTGSSKAFSLYEMSHPAIEVPENTIDTFLGTGLSGNVTGELGRIPSLKLGDFKFKKPVVAYPDSISIRRAFKIGDRHGSIGGETFRRFKVIFHYQKGSIFLRKNGDFSDKFNYNASGLEVSTPLANLPYYEVSDVRKGSPADKAGLKVGDVLESINRRPIESYSLSEIHNLFYNKDGSRISIKVQRNDTTKLNFFFRMKDELKMKSDSES